MTKLLKMMDRIQDQESIINEMDSYFRLQDTWLESRDNGDLNKMKIQGKKVRDMIRWHIPSQQKKLF